MLVGVVDFVQAADKPDPTGTWTWRARSRDVTLKLKLEGDILSGAIVGRSGHETPIEDPQYKDGRVSFKVTRQRNGQKTTTAYTGTLNGDTITGKFETAGPNGNTSHDWVAKRTKT
jgi:hypothetical protein